MYLQGMLLSILNCRINGGFWRGRVMKERTSVADFANAERQRIFISITAMYCPVLRLTDKFSELSGVKSELQSADPNAQTKNSVNPYVAISDPRDITVGNPILLPEVTDQFELALQCQSPKAANINCQCTFTAQHATSSSPILTIHGRWG